MLSFLFITGAFHKPTGFGPGVLSIRNNPFPVYKDMGYTGCILMRLFESSVVLNLGCIKDHHVCKIALLKHTATLQAEVGGWQGS